MKAGIIITTILVIFLKLAVSGQNVLVTEITGLKDLKGDLYVSLYDKESSWMFTDSAYRKVLHPAENDPETIILKGLPEGDYAMAIFLDINRNGSMDETEMKIPREPFGFSNNPKGVRGPASFQQAQFYFNCQDTLRIELVNNIFTPNKEKNEKKK